jgi:DNA-binding transcriptional MerR regulator
MNSSALVAVLRAPESTIRKFASKYAGYLSPSAQGGGRHRDYTDLDARIIRLIIVMKRENQTDENIETTLSSLQASNWERLPQLDETALSVMPLPGGQIIAGMKESAMLREIEVMQRDHEREVNMLREMLKDERADRDELLRRLHEAEQLVRLYESGRIKPE